jgi:hypothetical protein
MIELLLSSLLVFFLPTLANMLTSSLGNTLAFIVRNITFLIALAVIGWVAYLINSKRTCSKVDVSYGFVRGAGMAAVTTFCYTLIGLIPVLRTPFAIIGKIPGLSGWVDSIIMTLVYLIPNALIYTMPSAIVGDCP